MKTLVLAALAALLATPALAADKTAAAPAKGNDALQAVLNQFDAAWDKGDARAMESLYAEDATLLSMDGKMSKGRAEIMSVMAPALSQVKGSKAHHTLSNARWIGKDWAFADVESTYENLPSESSAPADMSSSPKLHIILLFHQQGGKWLVVDSRPYTLASEPAATPAPAATAH